MFLFLNSLSRSVHQEQPEPGFKRSDDHQDKDGQCTSLTVWRKSLVISCNGFTVFDSSGNLAYRVDSYIGSPHDELILMDASGISIFTMRRHKRLAVTDSWHVFEGEVDDCSRRKKLPQRPVCCVKKQNMMSNILQSKHDVLAYVYYGASSNKRYAYRVEGSFTDRSCQVLDDSMRVVAEIKRKEAAIGGVSFGVEVFLLVVHPGFDPGFAMALVLLLDQMFS